MTDSPLEASRAGVSGVAIGAKTSINQTKVNMPKVQILVVNPLRELPTKSGGTFQIQDAETVILDDAGQPEVVGPLSVPRDLIGKVVPGMYDAVFKWERDYKSGRLVSNLQNLTPVVRSPAPQVPKAS
jgi:hypothetical protein